MAPYLKKGTGVLVSGEPSTREYEDRDGIKRASTDLQVDKLVLLGSPKQGEQRRDEQPRGYGAPSGRRQEQDDRRPINEHERKFADEYAAPDYGLGDRDVPF